MVKVDITAPIVPFEGMGGIRLYATMEELGGLLARPDVSARPVFENCVRYDVADALMLFFHLGNRKLYKITTQEGYAGSLLGAITTRTHQRDLRRIDPQIRYDDFEEVWLSPKGYLVETDGGTLRASWISVYVREMMQDDFDSAGW